MKLSGAATMHANPEAVYAACNDPAVLARCLPGCEKLTEIGPSHYTMTITAGVAAIKGTYEGEVALVDGTPPSSFTLKVSGVGGPGTVSADVLMRLAPSATGGTDLTYDADAVVGGTIDGELLGAGAAVGSGAGAGAGVPAVLVDSTGARVFLGKATSAAGGRAGAGLALNQGAAYLIGALVGGALALAGAALGARIARRH